jgi:hypothetical protein
MMQRGTNMTTSRTRSVLLVASLLAVLAGCEGDPNDSASPAWSIDFEPSVASLDLGYITYEDALPTAELSLANASGISLLLRSVEIEGYGTEIIQLAGAPAVDAEIGASGSIELDFSVSDEVDWQTGWYTPLLVVTAASAERGDDDLADQRWTMPVVLKVRCDLDGDGYDAVTCGGTDCDDGDYDVHLGADDLCNGVDDDCDGLIDESPDTVWYPDGDGDGYGVEGETTIGCEAVSGHVDNADDCDDEDPEIHPEADELCNEIDDNCDGQIDEEPSVDPLTWYQDADGDGWGNEEVTTSACAPPTGYVEQAGDCDDSDGHVHPGLGEICDEIDQDCDGEIDEDPVADGHDYHADVDGDGYGDAYTAVYDCEQPSGYVEDDSDCNDSDANINPDAIDECGDDADGVDDDCDGVVDNLDDAVEYYQDADADGYGDSRRATVACNGEPSGYAADASDCDDGDSATNPGATEQCGNGVDDDCDDLLDCDDDDCDGVLPCSLALVDADAEFIGEAAADQAGLVVAGAGFVDGDAYADILVASPTEDSNGSDAGAAYLIYGPVSGSVDLSAADAKFLGEAAGDQAGMGLAWAGDFDGDGFDDVVVGAPTNDGLGADSGHAYLMFGPVTGTVDLAVADLLMVGSAADDAAGGAVACVGDTNGDGMDDLLIGATGRDGTGTDEGAAYLVLGGAGGSLLLRNADAILTGESTDDLAGGSVAWAGDTDGDGYDDMLVGAEGRSSSVTDAGVVYLVPGPLLGELSLNSATARISGLGSSDGLHVAATGDMDGDGTTDFLVGVDGDDTVASNAGAVHVLLGPLSGSVNVGSADGSLYGTDASTYLGASLAVVPDLDGDGRDEPLVGAWGASFDGVNAGAGYLLPWPWSSALAEDDGIPMGGGVSNDRAGYSVAVAGDVDADGLDDILIGAPYEDSGGSAAGAAYLVLGSNF